MEEIDLKELIETFWEKKLLIILILAIFVTIGVIYTLGFVVPKYQSTTTLLLATNLSPDTVTTGNGAITTTDVTINSKLVSTYSELVESKKIIRNVISNLALDVDEESIRQNVSVSAVADTEIIEIKVKNEDPVLAAKITNEMAKVFMENVKEFYGMENVHVVDEAEVETHPYNVNHIKTVTIFAFVGIVVAIMFILVQNMLDTTVKSANDIERLTDLTILASIPIYDMQENNTKAKRKGGRK